MDVQSLRRAVPLFYGALVIFTLYFARDAFFPVLIGGAVLMGVLLVLTGPKRDRDEGGRQQRGPRRR